MFHLRNPQRTRRIHTGFLGRIIRSLLRDHLRLGDYELGIHLIGEPAMAQMNQQYLGHDGPTDVITFDYTDPSRPGWLAGDIFICVPVALVQAELFGTSWQEELVRYIVHGILHLQGFDDKRADVRTRMKAEEDRLVKKLAGRLDLRRLGSLPAKQPGSGQHKPVKASARQ